MIAFMVLVLWAIVGIMLVSKREPSIMLGSLFFVVIREKKIEKIRGLKIYAKKQINKNKFFVKIDKKRLTKVKKYVKIQVQD